MSPDAQARARSWLPVLAILAAAVALTLPAALGPVRLNDSFWIDWVWLDQFAEQLRRGVLYPRWLPQSHGGLGSPVFYYYPPLAFYLGSAFVLGGLGTYAALLATFGLAYALSGAAMYWWLRDQAARPLLGALVYMVAPYHVFNFYQRGAVAEFVATALLPLVMLAIRSLSAGSAGAFVLLAVSYAALIGSHGPLALLASLFLIGPYALIEYRQSPRVLLRAVAALLLGVALAAIYLVPALELARFRDASKLWAFDYLQPSTWSVWRSDAWSMRGFRAILVVIAAAALPTISLLARNRSRWALWSLACLLLAAGVVPFLWSLPLLRSVQFPFRLLPVAEFALATAVAMAPRRALSWPVLWVPLAAMFAFIATGKPEPVPLTLAELQRLHPDVPENLPPGTRPYSWPSQWALALAANHRAPTQTDGLTLEPVFYFPGWEVSCGGRTVASFAAPATALLAHRGTGCTRALKWTQAERSGALLSLASLLLLFGALVAGRYARRKRPRSELSR